jgi:nucleotide-binding universal stress UspA family protein
MARLRDMAFRPGARVNYGSDPTRRHRGRGEPGVAMASSSKAASRPKPVFSRVLIATDFSENSEFGASLAYQLAGASATYRLVHVLPDPDDHLPLLRLKKSDVKRIAKHRKNRLHAAQSLLGDLAARVRLERYETAVLLGSIGAAIAREVSAFDADLVVVGADVPAAEPHGFAPAQARYVLRATDRSILIARGKDQWTADRGPHRITVATDLLKNVTPAGRIAHRLATQLGSELTAAHVMDADLWIEMTATQTGEERSDEGPTWNETEEQLGQKLHEFNVDQMEGAADEVVILGKPREAILELVRQQKTNLLILGSRGPRTIGNVRLGSVASDVTESAPCSVLLVR